jgi:glycosyltransferase involved in cell wall biosynthesis
LASDDHVTVEILQDGNRLGTTVAKEQRLDLKERGRGTGEHAFVFEFAEPIVSKSAIEVRVVGSDYVLPQSYELMEGKHSLADKSMLLGHIDEVSDDQIIGWVCFSDLHDRLEIEAFGGGMLFASAKANVSRPDLVAAGIGDGCHGFELHLNTRKFINANGGFRLKGGAAIPVLQQAFQEKAAGLRQSVETGAPTYAEQSQSKSGEKLTGHGAFLGVVDGTLLGWAILQGNRTRLLLTANGQMIGEVEARGMSAVQAGSCPEAGRHGFALALAPKTLKSLPCRFVAYDATTGARLAGLNKTLSTGREIEPASYAADKHHPGTHALSSRARMPEPAHRPQQAPDNISGEAGRDAKGVQKPAGKRIAVVAWDMAHNPVGRAFLLADMLRDGHDVELIGPTFAFYGGRVWPPIAGANLPMRSFAASDLRSLVAGAVELAKSITCDAVVVGKPRLSSLLIGALVRHANNCPLILDIDDHELSFVKDRTPLDFDQLQIALDASPSEASVPYSDIWTRFAETLTSEADGIIVSNVALRRKFGGFIIRHGRNEAVFDPALHDRQKIRRAFGYGDEDRVVLFLGTPRPHKGIFELCDALERCADPRLALCVIGTVTDKRTLKRFADYKTARLALHPDEPWERLPELVNMADAVAILQDNDSPIAEFQIPAKLTDALAMNVQVLATPVPPLEDVALTGALQMVGNPSELDAALRLLADSPAQADGRDRGRELFLSEFSYGVNSARLRLAIDKAVRTRKPEVPTFERLFRLLERQTGIALPRLESEDASPTRRRQLPVRSDRLPDLVFLWKQNDSDVYGRRSDMVVRYLLRTKRVGRIIHFDAPISAAALDQHAAAAAGEIAHQGNLIYLNTVRRVLQAADTPGLIRRTFLHRSGSRPERALGKDLPPREGYGDFIRSVLRDLKVSQQPILWTCPIVPEYAAALEAVDPGFVVADVIDDQRTFPGSSESYRKQIADAYELMLGTADAVFSNCEPVRDAFSALRKDIKMVPNGAEVIPDIASWEPAADLAGLPRPIIGYVGNLRDRVDFELIEMIAERYPHGTVVLVGSAHGRPEVNALAARRENVRLLGVKPFDEAQRIMRGLDVAIMPHLKSEQSERMNPLKLYVYFSVGVQVVTTDVANIGDLAPYVNVASNQEEFLANVALVLSGNGRKVEESDRARVLAKVSWESRVADIWRHLEGQAET